MLTISKVETFYGNIQALRGVDVKVKSGEIVALIGSNGAGKSTLLMTISGVNKASTGQIVFDNQVFVHTTHPKHYILRVYEQDYILLLFVGSSFLATRFAIVYKKALGVEESDEGTRGGSNVISNGILPPLIALAYSFGLLSPEQALVAFTTSMAAASADTMASEIGVLSPSPVLITNPGTGYSTAPAITVTEPTGPGNAIAAQLTGNINAQGEVTGVNIITTGFQYTSDSPPSITFAAPVGGGTTAEGTAITAPILYTVDEATLPSNGISTVTLVQNLNNDVGFGSTAYFSRQSLQIASSHSFEYVGAGNAIETAATDFGMPPEMLEAGMNAAQDTFNDALANGASPEEAFGSAMEAGGNAAAQSEAISRLISLSLRSGLDPKAIVRQLKGISGPNPTWENGRLILSTPDAIGKALDDYLLEKNTNSEREEKKNSDSPRITLAPERIETEGCHEGVGHMECPNIINEGGCLTCRECGWSKCD